jgi:hypothetical protein
MFKYEGFEKKTIFDWPIMAGGKIIPCSRKNTGNKNLFQPRQKKSFLKIIYGPFLFAINSFSKIRSINCDRDGFMC